ncbi:MAG: DNA cytosine methyltransferase [Candidatus Cloacimonadota bacterium]|nr:MAG: DNA cytosine methyltransferase [Candidatus Cloacimonadota bacterium]
MSAPYSSADFFQGIGGSSLALQNQDFQVVAAIDNDPVACNWYEKNIGLEPICEDLNFISGDSILDHYGLERARALVLDLHYFLRQRENLRYL